MTMPELLEEIRGIQGEMRRLEGRMESLTEMATRANTRLSAVRYGGTANHCKHEHAVLEKSAIECETKELREKWLGLCARLIPYIELMPPSAERSAARLWYLEGLSCARIGDILHYDRRHVYRLLGSAKETLEQLAAVRRLS